MEIILMAFLKKIFFRANGPFRTKNGTSSQLWICRQDRFTILQNEREMEIRMVSLKKMLFGAIWYFSPKNGASS